jgi:two-component system OmpR family response regulator
MSKNILVIEDNPDIAHLVSMHLSDRNMHVDIEAEGGHGLEQALLKNYDLIVLDLMLPGMDGMDVCRALRQREVYTPVLMLTARNSEVDRVLGLEAGADDYLAKPFSVAELVARVTALLRRVEIYDGAVSPGQEMRQMEYGPLRVDPQRRQVLLAGKVIELTAKEFDLLWHFASNPGRVYTRSQLLDSVWGYGHVGYEHTVNSHINRLRAKIEHDPSNPCYVLTVWGVGYKFTTAGGLS